ncbi:unnamed protein product, partial [Mycena citricolor]
KKRGRVIEPTWRLEMKLPRGTSDVGYHIHLHSTTTARWYMRLDDIRAYISTFDRHSRVFGGAAWLSSPSNGTISLSYLIQTSLIDLDHEVHQFHPTELFLMPSKREKYKSGPMFT